MPFKGVRCPRCKSWVLYYGLPRVNGDVPVACRECKHTWWSRSKSVRRKWQHLRPG